MIRDAIQGIKEHEARLNELEADLIRFESQYGISLRTQWQEIDTARIELGKSRRVLRDIGVLGMETVDILGVREMEGGGE